MAIVHPCFCVVARRAILVWLLVGFVGACGPSEADEAYRRGQEALTLGNFSQALEAFNEAIRLDPRHAEAYLGRGTVYWQQFQYAKALPEFNRAIQLQPDLIMAYYLRGASLIAVRRYGEGVADFTTVTASGALPDEDLVRAHRWRAIGLLNLQRYQEAVVDFTRCIELQPDQPYHYVERGRVYQALRHVDNARADYEAALARYETENDVTAEVRERLAALGGAAPE